MFTDTNTHLLELLGLLHLGRVLHVERGDLRLRQEGPRELVGGLPLPGRGPHVHGLAVVVALYVAPLGLLELLLGRVVLGELGVVGLGLLGVELVGEVEGLGPLAGLEGGVDGLGLRVGLHVVVDSHVELADGDEVVPPALLEGDDLVWEVLAGELHGLAEGVPLDEPVESALLLPHPLVKVAGLLVHVGVLESNGDAFEEVRRLIDVVVGNHAGGLTRHAGLEVKVDCLGVISGPLLHESSSLLLLCVEEVLVELPSLVLGFGVVAALGDLESLVEEEQILVHCYGLVHLVVGNEDILGHLELRRESGEDPRDSVSSLSQGALGLCAPPPRPVLTSFLSSSILERTCQWSLGSTPWSLATSASLATLRKYLARLTSPRAAEQRSAILRFQLSMHIC